MPTNLLKQMFTNMVKKTTCVALVKYNYQADNSDELNLKVGDEIVDVGFVEPGWCQGNLNGQVGMFPDNFVEVCLVSI